MSSDSSIFRYEEPEGNGLESRKAEKKAVTSSRTHPEFRDISHEIGPENIQNFSSDRVPRAAVNPGESQVEGTKESIFSRAFTCFLCGCGSNLPPEVKQNLGQRFSIDGTSSAES